MQFKKKKRWDGLKEPHSLPHVGIEHGLYVPPRAESTEAFAKTLIVDCPSVDREETHQQNQIPAPKHHPPDLKHTHFSSSALQCCIYLSCISYCCSHSYSQNSRVPKYLWITSLVLFLSFGSFSSRTIQREANVISRPWPTSPNITANRKGKVIMVYTAVEAFKQGQVKLNTKEDK